MNYMESEEDCFRREKIFMEKIVGFIENVAYNEISTNN